MSQDHHLTAKARVKLEARKFHSFKASEEGEICRKCFRTRKQVERENSFICHSTNATRSKGKKP